MRLRSILEHIGAHDGGLTIYAVEPWSPDSPAVLAATPNDGRTLPPEAEQIGAVYFLEVFLVQELVEDLSAMQEYASPEALCHRVVAYAIDDA